MIMEPTEPSVIEEGRKPVFRITSENARILAQRSAQVRRERKLIEDSKPPEPPALPVSLPVQSGIVNPQVARLESHIARLDELIDKARVPSELRDLSQARTRFFADWQTLTGLERPGVRKVSKRPAPTAIDPITEPTPQQLVDVPIFGRQNIAV